MFIFLIPVLLNLSLAVLPHPLNLLLIELVLNPLVALDVVVHVEHEGERDAIVDLHSLHRLPVKGEPSQVDEQDRRAVRQLQALLRIHLLFTCFTLVLVAAVEFLWLDIVF
jgi:hypothetical protein